jgi:hypothetical protein
LTVDPLLTESYNTRIESNQVSAFLGFSVASAGDVNGDGYGDIVIGAPRYDIGQNDEGAAWVFKGSAAGIVTTLPITAFIEYQSDQRNAELGTSVSGAGDVNGDGYDDVIVGAPGYDGGQADEGAAFVFLGGASGIDGTPTTAFFDIQTNLAGSALGTAVAGAGDINGDGYADLVVGGGNRASIVLGASAGPSSIEATIVSNRTGGEFGASVSGAGDLNGDGFADVVIGSPGSLSQSLSSAYVFYGSASGIAATSQLDADLEISSNQSAAQLGTGVAGAGDVNGDGYGDLIVGARNWDQSQLDEGAAFVFHGSALGIVGSDSGDAAQILLEGDDFANLGVSVSAAGDVDGDGYADVIVGAHSFSGATFGAGAAFVYRGGPAGVDANAYATLFGANQADRFGVSVAGGADVNGDGYSDVVVGAYLFESGSAGIFDEGAAYVYHGGGRGIRDFAGGPTAPGLHRVLSGGPTNNDFGYTGLVTGDFNCDGYADLVAPDASDGSTGPEGAVYVFYGSSVGIPTPGPTGADLILRSVSPTSFGFFGFAVGSIGDVNGDGCDDLAVLEVLGGTAQQVNIYHGATLGLETIPATILTAAVAGSEVYEVAAAGDVNGDGFGDLIVGSPFYSAPSPSEGAAYVFHGSASGIPSGDVSTAQARIEGDQTEAYLGTSVAGIGDVNGDGFSDIAVGTDRFDAGAVDEGIVLVFYGGPAGVGNGDPGNADHVIEGGQPGLGIGRHLAATDVNNDGFSDLIVGTFSDRFLVFLGSASGPIGNDAFTAHAVVVSAQPSSFGGDFAEEVKAAGDLNGDGYGDVVVASAFYDVDGADSGAAFVYLGSSGGISASSSDDADAILSGNPTEPGSNFGQAVTGGDFNGDGFSDIAASAPDEDTGKVYVFLGGETPGRPGLPEQLRFDGSGTRVAPGGGSGEDGFQVRMRAAHPDGRGLVKLQVQYCIPGIPFGQLGCFERTQTDWTDTQASSGVTLTETIFGSPGSLYRWRARILYAPLSANEVGITSPPKPSHGPWRRPTAMAVEADVRTVPEPGAFIGLLAGGLVLNWMRRSRAGKASPVFPRASASE